jgi:hypothetical protein
LLSTIDDELEPVTVTLSDIACALTDDGLETPMTVPEMVAPVGAAEIVEAGGDAVAGAVGVVP